MYPMQTIPPVMSARYRVVQVLEWGSGAQCMKYLLRIRDLVGFSCCYESALRGKNAGSLAAVDVQDGNGQPLLQRLLACCSFPFPAGFMYQLAPHGTKAKRLRRAGDPRCHPGMHVLGLQGWAWLC